MSSGRAGTRVEPRAETNATDAELMYRCQGGEKVAFGELYDRYSNRALRMVRSVCRNSIRSEEILEDGFRLVWSSRANFTQRDGTFQAWAMGIVNRNAIDSTNAPDERSGSALGGVSDDEAEVISLAFYGELSRDEIAKLLDLSTHAVGARMTLGLTKMRHELPGA